MPGICGIVGGSHDERVFEAMRERMMHAPWYRDESFVDDDAGIALGRVSLGYVNTQPQPARCSATGSVAIMDGEIYRVGPLRERVAQKAQPPGESQAELLLQGYLTEGTQFFRDVDGKFNVAIWDARKNSLVLINDRLGMKPLYFAKLPEKLLFASEIKSLFADESVPRNTSSPGTIQFFTFGHLWNNETLYESIETLGPAQYVQYNVESGEVDRQTYWALSDVPNDRCGPAEILDRIDHRLKSQVDALTTATEGLGLSLSGGLDARTVLGLVDHRSVSMKCICMGMDGSLDQRTARELAELAGYSFHRYVLDERFKADFTHHLNRMVHLTDGQYLSQCIVMPTFPFYEQLGVRVLLRGHAGELMHMTKAYNFSLDKEGQQLSGNKQLEHWLFKKLRGYMLDAVDDPLLTFATEADVEDVARDAISGALSSTENWESTTNRIAQLFVSQRLRRETALSLVKFNSVVETRLPYVDPELVQLLLAVPPSLRMNDSIQSHILQRHAPSFMKPTNANTGASMGAGKLTNKLSYAKMRVLAKLGVRGYQPYERLGLWLRRELRDQVKAILLDDACLDRGTFRPDAVRKIVAQHLANQRNHTFLLMAMMIYETGQRKWNSDSGLLLSSSSRAAAS